MANANDVKDMVWIALNKEAKKQTKQRGFQSGEFKIDNDDWDELVDKMDTRELGGNSYKVSLPSDISVDIQPGRGVAIGAVSGTAVGGGVGGVSGATIGAVVGTVVPGIGNLIGAGVGGLIGAGVGSVVGLVGGGGGGAVIGKAVKKYGQKFSISAKDILGNFSGFKIVNNIVYATVNVQALDDELNVKK